MDFFVNAMHKGGVFMYPILLLVIVTPLATLILAVVSALRVRIPALLWLLGPLILVLMGVAGRLQGQMMAEQAVRLASEEYRATMCFSGLSVAAFTEVTALLCAGYLLPLVALAVAIAHCISRGAVRRPTSISGILGLGIGLVATLSCGVVIVATEVVRVVPPALFLAVPVALLAGMLASGLVGLSAEGKPKGADTYGVRALLAVISLLALASLCAAGMLWGQITIWEAMARASAETRATIAAHGMSITTGSLQLGIVAMVGAGLAAFCGLARGGWRSVRPVSAILAGLPVLGIVALLVLSKGQADDLAVAFTDGLDGVLPDMSAPSLVWILLVLLVLFPAGAVLFLIPPAKPKAD